MRNREIISGNKVDWLTIIFYALLVFLGWLNIYAAVYDEATHQSIFDTSLNSGKQLIWIGTSLVLIFVIMIVDYKFYDTFGYVIFGTIIFMLVFVLLFGREVAGTKGWFEIGPFRLQPAEFAKFATSLALAKYLKDSNVKLSTLSGQLRVAGILGIPILLIVLQPDIGTAMVFAILSLALYREGLPGIYLLLGLSAGGIFALALLFERDHILIGIAVTAIAVVVFGKKTKMRIRNVVSTAVLVAVVVTSVEYVISDVFMPHQQNRIKALVNPEADPLGYGWNVTQSKIAIGSGGLIGKGFLEGTQTKFDFVPEQSTDFIFCTIGEEHGWIGSLLLITLFVALLYRVIFLAERQKSRMTRFYGYAVASILFFHFAVNIGMTIGLFPVVGIPLPFFSYGGSSLWSFTILLFILIKLDAHRAQMSLR